MDKLKHVRVEKKENGVTEVILCQPEKYNSMNGEFFTEIHKVFTNLDQDSSTNVILLWAEGKMFTSGLDLKFATFLVTSKFKILTIDKGTQLENSLKLYNLVQEWQNAFTIISKNKKPVIAAIHSNCIGGGVDLITSCDIRLCTKDAKFSVKETKLAIVADLGTIQRLTRIVGKGATNELVLTGDDINSKRALEMGLVNHIYENQEELLKEARKMATSIASNSPLVVQASKKMIAYSEEHSIEDGLKYVALWNSAFLKSEDLQEAFISFMQKRPPKFKNRL